MSEYTLVVVDMQYGFSTALEELTILGCQEQIKNAIQENNPIVFVEFFGYRETLLELTQLTANYNNKFVLCKSCDNGGHVVQDVISKNNLPQNIKICGVNVDCCVWQTAKFLSTYYKIELIATAVNSCLGLIHLSNVFEEYRKYTKIQVSFESIMTQRIMKKLAA